MGTRGPADPENVRALADHLASVYADAQRRLAEEVARRLRDGIESPTWQADKLASLGELRRWAEKMAGRLTGETRQAAADTVARAYAQGSLAATAELARAGRVRPLVRDLVQRTFPNLPAQQRVAGALALKIEGTHLPMIRWATDAYQRVVAAGAAPDVLLGTHTRLQASQRAWNRLLDDGVTGFRDAAGRRWNLAGYVEMATRTTVAQAAVEGQLDRLADASLDLVIVSNAAQECERCRPWEGKILMTHGGHGARTVQRQSEASAHILDVPIAGTVDEAIAAGLFHPQCRHSVSAYVPGVTRPVPGPTADPEGDAARQKLRAMERAQRADRLKLAAPIDPDALPAIRARIAARTDAIKAHVAANEHTGLRRVPGRERIDLGYKRTGSAPPTPAPIAAPRPTPKPTPAERPVPAGKGPLPNRSAETIDQIMKPIEGRALLPSDLAHVRVGQAIDGTYGGLRAVVREATSSPYHINVTGKIYNAEGNPVGDFTRLFVRRDNGQLIAKHEYLNLHSGAQGSGFANEFNRNLFDWYRRSGVHHVEVHADIDVGGYTWARQGFDFRDAAEAERYLKQTRSVLEELAGEVGAWRRPIEFPGATDAEFVEQIRLGREYLEQVARGERKASAYELSQVGRKPGMGRDDGWIGKALMIGSDWQGVFVL